MNILIVTSSFLVAILVNVSSSSGANLNERCPTVDGQETVYLTKKGDCSSFYECGNGVAYEFQCPAGLSFNQDIRGCDWPSNVECKDGDEEEPSSSGDGSSDEDNSNTNSASSENDNNSYDNSGTQSGEPKEPGTTNGPGLPEGSGKPNEPESPKCSKVDGQNSVYFSKKDDCSSFYQCSNGVPVEFKCPANLYFNSNLNVCDWPWNVGCKGGQRD